MAFGMASEYAVAALFVALTVWKRSTRSYGDSRCCGSRDRAAVLREGPTWPVAADRRTVCLALWTMIFVRRNGRERHYLEQLKRELADL